MSVEKLTEQAANMENELKGLRDSINEHRLEFHALNYFTTQQLLQIRRDLGNLRQDDTAKVTPQLHSLLRRFSLHITSNDIKNEVEAVCYLFNEQEAICKKQEDTKEVFEVELPLVARANVATELAVNEHEAVTDEPMDKGDSQSELKLAIENLSNEEEELFEQLQDLDYSDTVCYNAVKHAMLSKSDDKLTEAMTWCFNNASQYDIKNEVEADCYLFNEQEAICKKQEDTKEVFEVELPLVARANVATELAVNEHEAVTDEPMDKGDSQSELKLAIENLSNEEEELFEQLQDLDYSDTVCYNAVKHAMLSKSDDKLTEAMTWCFNNASQYDIKNEVEADCYLFNEQEAICKKQEDTKEVFEVELPLVARANVATELAVNEHEAVTDEPMDKGDSQSELKLAIENLSNEEEELFEQLQDLDYSDTVCYSAVKHAMLSKSDDKLTEAMIWCFNNASQYDIKNEVEADCYLFNEQEAICKKQEDTKEVFEVELPLVARANVATELAVNEHEAVTDEPMDKGDSQSELKLAIENLSNEEEELFEQLQDLDYSDTVCYSAVKHAMLSKSDDKLTEAMIWCFNNASQYDIKNEVEADCYLFNEQEAICKKQEDTKEVFEVELPLVARANVATELAVNEHEAVTDEPMDKGDSQSELKLAIENLSNEEEELFEQLQDLDYSDTVCYSAVKHAMLSKSDDKLTEAMIWCFNNASQYDDNTTASVSSDHDVNKSNKRRTVAIEEPFHKEIITEMTRPKEIIDIKHTVVQNLIQSNFMPELAIKGAKMFNGNFEQAFEWCLKSEKKSNEPQIQQQQQQQSSFVSFSSVIPMAKFDVPTEPVR